MATNFPTSADSFTNPTGADTLNSPDHAAQHANANDAIEAIEAKVGTAANNNAPASNKLLRGTGANTSEWDIDFKDEDDMASDSATAVASQQSVKAYVDRFKNYKARATRTTNQENLVDNTYTKVQLNVETYDPNGDFDSATNYRYTVPIDGYYLVTANLTIFETGLNAGKLITVNVYKNGASFLASFVSSPTAVATTAVAVSNIVYLEADDYLELYARVANGDNNADILGPQTWLAIHFMSPS